MRARLVAAAVCVVVLASGFGGGDEPAGSKLKVLVLGDSIAQGYARGLERDARTETINAASVNCSLVTSGILQGYRGDQIGQGCDNWRTEWPALVTQHQPDVVLVGTGGWEIVNRWFENPGVGPAATIRDQVFADAFVTAYVEAASLLSATGAAVVFSTSTYVDPDAALPTPEENPQINEIWYEAYGPKNPPANWQPPVPGQEFVPAKEKIERLNELKVEAGEKADVPVLDINGFIQPKGKYAAKYKGEFIRHADRSHFNERGYDLIAEFLVPKLRKAAKS
ncbi:MAG: hypothetical protein H0V95_06900 [Actinobacteria bacterium]|nr:hypothetical protein [Actinomycetota bacterium]